MSSHLHYDFRLEWRRVLLSWAVPKGPSLDPAVKRLAMQTEDHPVEYADFEGVIPAGQYGSGTVMLWDRPTWQPQNSDVDASLQKGEIKFTLFGKKLQGSWVLVRTRGLGSDPIRPT
jgi:bifunctional non-homologous end joining protein LigD